MKFRVNPRPIQVLKVELESSSSLVLKRSLLHKNLNFLSSSKKFEPMPGLGLTKLELFNWLSGKNLPQLKIQYGDCTLSGQIFLSKNLKNLTA